MKKSEKERSIYYSVAETTNWFEAVKLKLRKKFGVKIGRGAVLDKIVQIHGDWLEKELMIEELWR